MIASTSDAGYAHPLRITLGGAQRLAECALHAEISAEGISGPERG